MSNRKATVYVRLKDGVLDPQGVTIQRAILNMGYDMINEICGKLLANPVIENFQVEFEK